MEVKDVCEFCRMTIMEKEYACEIVTDKGRYYTFDDISCMVRFVRENPEIANIVKDYYVTDFFNEEQLIEAPTAIYYISEALRTPMNGKTVALSDSGSLLKMKDELPGLETTWEELLK